MAAHRQSSYVTVTRAFLTAGATVALTRVFAGAAWFVPVLIAAMLPAAILELGERRRWNPWAATGLVVIVGAWFTVLVDDPSETFLGFPTPSALATAGHDLTRAPHVLRSAVVPVAPVGAAMMLAVAAVLVTALATELIAKRLDAPVGAIGPSIALFVAICALGSGHWAFSTACYGVAVVEYLVALQYADLLTRRTWFQSSAHRRSQLAVGGAIIGVAVVLVALVAGPGIPGARSAAWVKYRSLGSGNGASILNVTSPLVSVKAQLSGRNSEVEVFSVKTSEPKGDYWRLIALDQFQDDGWGLNSDQKSASKLPGETHGPGATRETQTFKLGATVNARWLPAAYRPTHIDVPGAQVLPNSTSLFVDQPLAGLTYNVESEVSNPSKDVLNAVTFDDLKDMEADTALPPDFSGKAKEFARQVTENATTPYEKALALMQVFRQDPFTYDQNVKPGASSHALDDFLFKTHKGFCEQYASAYAELARSIGLPTRVAVGYQPGTKGSDGLWHVREKDAHAWPEVWLGQEIGWYRFEPTPGRTDPITGLPGGRANGAGGPTTTTTPTTTAPNTPTTNAANNPAGGARFPQERDSNGTPQSGTRAHVLTGIAITLAALLFIAIVLAIAIALTAWRRSSHRRHDPDNRRRVLGAWSEALERLSAAGIVRRPSATSLEFALRQAPALGAGAAGPPLMSLARLHTAAMYSPEAPSREDADIAWSEVDAIADALRTSTPWSKRVRARFAAVVPRRSRARRSPDLENTENAED